ncbi:MAG: alpha-hydroxy-acid oxidizing protein [Erysipelotrichaceae bacterium]|nr:alpha-hydroxy-acid oxidizing protein [Erysipelotrichaceae bacterium]MDY5252048.1 alpha-hydroxy-acid oxidizing protein [Erysipelotrichaceae bacterium]
MDLQTIKEVAKEKCSKCYVCEICNGRACKGKIPGMGGKDSGEAFIRNVEAFKNIKINMGVLADSKQIDTSLNWFGNKLSMPVFIAPIAGIKNNYGASMSEYDYNLAAAQGAKLANIMAFCGDGKDVDSLFVEPFTAMESVDDRSIITMKPWVKEGIDMRLAKIKGHRYACLAMDVDSAGLPLLRNSSIPVENKNVAALSYVKQQIDKPFIVKGIMNVKQAEMAIAAGCEAIVVSNHGGRVCDETLATIEVLADIAKACKGKVKILIDGGIRSGYDIFKCLALGADGVLIGRPMGIAIIGGQAEGVKAYVDKLQQELIGVMIMTGCHSLSDITADKVVVLK